MPVHQQYGSYYRVFVSPMQGILTAGSTYNLAAGQVGIFDGNTYQAVTAPTAFQNKNIIIAQGMNPQKMPLMMGIPNSFSEKAEPVFGNRITGWRAYRGHAGQSELVAVGYPGDGDLTKTLTMRKNEKRHLWILLTGAPINKMYSSDGLMLKYTVDTTDSGDCCDGDCSDCDPIDCNLVADNLVKRINKDEGIMRHNGWIRAFKKTLCNPPTTPPADTWNIFNIVVPDDGSVAALGRVQAQYPGFTVKKIARSDAGSTSTYQMYRINADGAPANLPAAVLGMITDCPTCPAGWTTTAGAHMFEVTSPTVPTGANMGGTLVGTPLKLSELGSSTTYLVATTLATPIATSLTTAEAIAGFQVRYLNDVKSLCTITSGAAIAWTDVGNAVMYTQEYRMTIKDPECTPASDWLATLTPLYAALGVVSVVATTETTPCVHTYSLTINSLPLQLGCTAEEAVFATPPSFKGAPWVKYFPAPTVTTCSCGVWIESAYVNRITNACTYGTFDYNADGIHIQISTLDPDYNALPSIDDGWPITHLRRFMQPTGFGAALQHLEERSKELFLKRFSYDVAVRDAYGFVLFADANSYYDQYALSFDQLKVNQSGFTDGSVNRHTLNVYYLPGKGKAYEDAINSYVASNPSLGIEPVALIIPS